ncbi:MAG: Tll0287-like domain-containing protein [Geminicoccaceae bacterium]
MTRTSCLRLLLALAVAGLTLGTTGVGFAATDDEEIALNLAELLRSSREVIAAHQDLINEPGGGDKGLTSDVVLDETITLFQASTGLDPRTVDPDSRMGRLFQAQIASIKEVVDEHQATINRPGLGFKGFVPAVFGRLVNERFKEKVGDQAQIKVTAPLKLVRNRGARPDAWETEHIDGELLDPAWPTGQVFTGVTEQNGREAFRMLVPEYYSAGCLSCHGEPKGEIDITGYPMEGGKLDDLGGVISITLFR